MKRSLWELWNIIKRNNIHIMEIPEGKVTKSIIKSVMAENFPNLRGDKWTSRPMIPKGTPKRATLRSIIIKWSKVREF